MVVVIARRRRIVYSVVVAAIGAAMRGDEEEGSGGGSGVGRRRSEAVSVKAMKSLVEEEGLWTAQQRVRTAARVLERGGAWVLALAKPGRGSGM